MEVVRKFHKMEMENALFHLGKRNGIPFWDVVRYSVYIKYYYSDEAIKKLEVRNSRTFLNFLSLLGKFISFSFLLFLKKGIVIVFTESRYKNENGYHFDKSALAFINAASTNDLLVMEPSIGKKLAYKAIYDFSNIFRRIKKTEHFPLEVYDKIKQALISSFGECKITFDDLNEVYHCFLSDLAFYSWFFSIKKPSKVFLAIGNPKAQVLAAKNNNATTYLLQHAGIEIDEIDYSYPAGVSKKDNIIFPDEVLTLGDYWGKNINIPGIITPVGNDFFYRKPITENDNSILIISTIIHGGELRSLTRDLALLCPNLKIKYKLHPNEFHLVDEYLLFFVEIQNVKVICDEIDTNILIAKSRLVILIVSAVLYEALNQSKKVVIYKKLNYERQLTLAKLPNVYLIDLASEVYDIIEKPIIPNHVNFYKATDSVQIKKLVSI